jgi:hypothetical protein
VVHEVAPDEMMKRGWISAEQASNLIEKWASNCMTSKGCIMVPVSHCCNLAIGRIIGEAGKALFIGFLIPLLGGSSDSLYHALVVQGNWGGTVQTRGR